MLRKIKNLFSNFAWNKKRLILAVLFFVILGLALPLRPVQAWDPFGIGEDVANWLIGLVFKSILLLGNLILQFAFLILSWVTGENFISLSYTGLDNPIIKVGWTLTRDLTNMFFVIILVIMGLATALRFGEYQWQKTLPRLIGIGLLINFTPVILGLVVDASNITMNFFLEKLSGFDAMCNAIGAQSETIDRTLGKGFVVLNVIPVLLQTIIIFAFDILATFLVFAFAALFIIRYVAIWILVILSPIAFACFILPATKSYFTNWWNQFSQWCMVGIIAAFFLYLGNHILINTGEIISASPPPQGIAQSFTPFINSLMPLFVALMFLGLGFFVALSTSAMGASGVINLAQKGAKTTGKWASKWAGKTTGTAIGRRVAPTVEKWGKELMGLGGKTKEDIAKKQEEIAKATGLAKFRWGIRQRLGAGMEIAGKGISSRIGISDQDEIAAATKKAQQIGDDSKIINMMREELLKGPLANKNDLAGFLAGLVNNGDSDKVLEAMDQGKLKEKDIGEIFNVARTRGGPLAYRPIAKGFYGRMVMNPEKFGIDKDTANKLETEIPDKITEEDIRKDIVAPENFNTDTDMGRFVIDQIVSQRGNDLLPQLLRRTKKEERKKIWEHLNKNGRQWYVKNELEDVLRWSISNAAQNLGFSGIDGIKTSEEIDALFGRGGGTQATQKPQIEMPPSRGTTQTGEERLRRRQEAAGQGTQTPP